MNIEFKVSELVKPIVFPVVSGREYPHPSSITIEDFIEKKINEHPLLSIFKLGYDTYFQGATIHVVFKPAALRNVQHV